MFQEAKRVSKRVGYRRASEWRRTPKATKQFGPIARTIHQDQQPDGRHELAKGHDRPADLVPVAGPGGGEGQDQGRARGRRHEQHRVGGAEAHAVAQDDGHEEDERVARHGGRQQVEGPKVQLPVPEVVEDLGARHGVLLGVAAVLVDAGQDVGLLAGREELVGPAGEVYYHEPAQQRDDDCDGALDDEDP